MLAQKNSYINSAYQQLQTISQDREKRLEYEAREKAVLDYNQMMYESEQRGIEQGLKQGKIEMILELIREGILTIQEGARRLNMDEKELEVHIK